MKTNSSNHRISMFTSRQRRFAVLAVAGALCALGVNALQAHGHGGEDRYVQENLVSDQDGVALTQDPDLVNAWGVSFNSSSPFWVSDNGTGKSTLYAVTNDSSGNLQVVKQSLIVQIPGEGNVTGQAFNSTGTGFRTNLFLFVSEDGTISGWRPSLGTNAEVMVSRDTAVYKGMTLAAGPTGQVMLVANFSEGTVDMYGTDLTLLGQFQDSSAKAGYAPFNVVNINGIIFVTFAKQDADKHDDVRGRGHGLIDTFNPMNGSFMRFVTGKDAGGKFKEIDSPWGVTLAPSTFGEHADELLVGNFGSGSIMTFDAEGKFHGLLKAVHKGPVKIDGLWNLTFGNGGRGGFTDTLYFTAGPDGEQHGLFGSLTPLEEESKGNGHGKK